MILTEPLPFEEAIKSRIVRSLLPTELRTDLLETIKPEILARARFSAGVVDAEFLQRAFDAVDVIADGKSDRATQRALLKRFLDSSSYAPPTGEEGTIADLRTDARLNLIIDTNVEMMTGAGAHLANQGDATRDQWPAAELYRARDSEEPRDWATRWRDAAGEVGDEAAERALEAHGRMVARTDSRIWYAISRFGQPHDPFDYNSGMRKRLVDRDDAIELGIIDRDTQVAADDLDINQDLKATPQVRAASLKAELSESLNGVAEFVGDVLQFVKNRELARTLNNANFDPSQPRDDDGQWTDSGGNPVGSRRRDFLGKRPAEGETHLPDDDNIERGKRAIEHLLNRKSGRVREAMFDKDLGSIEFAWGNTGIIARKHIDGGGIAHIASKHPADLRSVPEWIVKGDKSAAPKWDEKNGVWKKIVTYKDRIVVLTSRSPKSPRAWLVTGFTP